MAKKKSTNQIAGEKVPDALLKVGDRVLILHYGGQKGRIIEYRGPLALGGTPVYRVLVRRKPRSTSIEVRQDQLVLLPAKE